MVEFIAGVMVGSFVTLMAFALCKVSGDAEDEAQRTWEDLYGEE